MLYRILSEAGEYRRAFGSPAPRLFVNDGGRAWDKNTLRRAAQKAWVAAGLERKKIHEIPQWRAVETHNANQGRRGTKKMQISVDEGGIAPGEIEDTPHIKLTKAKIAQTELETQRAVLRLEEERGRLVDVNKVKKDAAALATILIGALSALPARTASTLASMMNEHEIDMYLQKEINDMISTIRKQCEFTDAEDLDLDSVGIAYAAGGDSCR